MLTGVVVPQHLFGKWGPKIGPMGLGPWAGAQPGPWARAMGPAYGLGSGPGPWARAHGEMVQTRSVRPWVLHALGAKITVVYTNSLKRGTYLYFKTYRKKSCIVSKVDNSFVFYFHMFLRIIFI